MTSQILPTQETQATETFVSLVRGHAAATRALSAELDDEHGLTLNDYEALLRLARAENSMMRRVDLADALLLTPSGVTRLLDGLERAGFVAKASCKTDARVTYAVLTPAGRKKLRQASKSHVASIRVLFASRYSAAELATLAELLSRLPDAAGADAGECAA